MKLSQETCLNLVHTNTHVDMSCGSIVRQAKEISSYGVYLNCLKLEPLSFNEGGFSVFMITIYVNSPLQLVNSYLRNTKFGKGLNIV